MCSDSVASMKGICPICNKEGYLILEKPRAKNHKPYWREFSRRNKQSKGYVTKRQRQQYFRFSHYNSNPCYIGCLASSISKLEKVSIIYENDLESNRTNLEPIDVNESLESRKIKANFQRFVKRAKEHFNKHYKHEPKDSGYIYSVIEISKKFHIIYDKIEKKYKLD